MDTGCLEVIVNRKPNTLIKAVCYGACVLTVCFCLLAFMTSLLFLIPAALCAAAANYFWLESAVDFEYVYVDKELRVAKIMQKQRRKELAVYDLTQMEVLAPVGSYHLDGFKNNDFKVIDYSSQGDENKASRYALILSDGTELILDMVGDYSSQILDLIRTFSPRKVFRD